MSELSQLSPQPLWDIFAKICSIPHPSYHEEQLAEYIVGWAKEKGFHVERDQVGNILIRKPATAGMENRKPVVLQAHLDMVPQKNNDTVHDFTKDPIQPYIDGEWVKARGTTLGADNGIGMASALAVLADENVVHGPLEVLLTMTEEAGMDGAFGLQSNWLQADILINTDSEEEGEIYMGCAGGIDFTSNLHLDREAVPAGFETFKLTLKGLKAVTPAVKSTLAWVMPTNCWCASWRVMQKSWTCALSISTVAHCVTPSRVKPLRPLLSQLIKSTP